MLIQNASRIHREHPGLASKTMTRTNTLHPEFSKRLVGHPELARKAGILGGEAAVKSGQIFKAQKGTFVYHLRHYHRSKMELQVCAELFHPKYGKHLHVNVHLGGLEVDWIVGVKGVRFNRFNPHTWRKVIEHHVVRTWEGETARGYKQKRIKKLRSLGVTCSIEVICK